MRNTEAIIESVDNLVDVLAQGWDLMDSTFQSLNCIEAEALADVARAAGDDTLAARIIDSHAEQDDEGELHFRGSVQPLQIGDTVTLASGRVGRVETIGSKQACVRLPDGTASLYNLEEGR